MHEFAEELLGTLCYKKCSLLTDGKANGKLRIESTANAIIESVEQE